jgi:hypothetical protein
MTWHFILTDGMQLQVVSVSEIRHDIIDEACSHHACWGRTGAPLIPAGLCLYYIIFILL